MQELSLSGKSIRILRLNVLQGLGFGLGMGILVVEAGSNIWLSDVHWQGRSDTQSLWLISCVSVPSQMNLPAGLDDMVEMEF